jgi:tRNA(His) guanylyltransferase
VHDNSITTYTDRTMAKSRFEYVRTFEPATDGGRLLPETYAVVRIDGRSFHRLSKEHEFRKPSDARALALLCEAAKCVMRDFQDIRLAYAQSDEVSFVFSRSCNLFGRRSAKICSTVVSLFSSAYAMRWPDFMREEGGSADVGEDQPMGDAGSAAGGAEGMVRRDGTTPANKFTVVPLRYPPSFDARVVCYPTLRTLRDYLSWRQADCHINNLYNTAFWAIVNRGGKTEQEAEGHLKDTVSSQKHELLFSEFGINYNDEPAQYRRGSILMYQDVTVPVTDSRTGELKERRTRQLQMSHDDLIGDEFWDTHPELFE